MFSKRGEVGEIIATIVIFSLILSLGVAGTTKILSKKFREYADCGNVNLKIEKSGNYDVCYVGTATNLGLKFKLKNSGEEEIKGVIVNMMGTRDTQKEILYEKISAGVQSVMEISYDKLRNGDINEMYVVPLQSFINASCYDKIIVTNNIGKCSGGNNSKT